MGASSNCISLFECEGFDSVPSEFWRGGAKGTISPSTPLFRRLFDIGSCVGVCKMHVVVEPKRFIVQIGQIFCSLSPGVLKGYVVCITYAIYEVG